MNITSAGTIDLRDARHVPSTFNEKRLSKNDVLFNNTNSPQLIGKTAFVGPPAAGKAFSNHMTRIVCTGGVDPQFAARQLHFLFSSGYFLHRCVKHVNQASISSGDLSRTVPLVIAPLAEQKRIVAKIEELFSELEAGEESLRLARRQLATYHQSLLKQAFEGKLTAQWREQNPDKLESCEANDVPPNELRGLAELPSGWRYQRFGTFISDIDAGKSFRCEERRPKQDEIGVAKVSAVTWGEYDEAESKTCIDPAKVNSAYFIKAGDFLISRANTVELVGACVIVRQVTQQVMLSDKTLRLSLEDAQKPYFLQYLRSHQGRREIEKRSTGNQESMRNIGQDRIRSIVVPMCPLPEQHEIVRLLDGQFEVIERNEREIDAALQRSEALRQSILHRAFTGRLVPQDPADEPATELLARLRAEKQSAPLRKPRSSKTKP
jgi:type I restriction enzyme S subunit